VLQKAAAKKIAGNAAEKSWHVHEGKVVRQKYLNNEWRYG